MRVCTGCGTHDSSLRQMKLDNPQMLACCPDNNYIGFLDFKTMKDKIKWLLEVKPETRDDDKVLYGIFVKLSAGGGGVEMGVNYLKSITALSFLRDVSKHNYVDLISLIRVRGKLQEQFVELRGKSYKPRQEADKFFAKNINKPELPQNI